MATKTEKAQEAQEAQTPATMEEMQAMVQRMLDEAKAEAARIVAQANQTAQGWNQADEAIREQREKALARGEEYVDVKLHRDNGKYKEPVFVAVNGENCVIERGVRVKVKRKFAEVLENSDRQDFEAYQMMDSKAAEFERSGI